MAVESSGARRADFPGRTAPRDHQAWGRKRLHGPQGLYSRQPHVHQILAITMPRQEKHAAAGMAAKASSRPSG